MLETDEMLKEEQDAIQQRNQLWALNRYIPRWVDLNTVGLDQFFTRPEIAQQCYNTFLAYLAKEGENIADYTFIEPSAGSGNFFKLLPPKQRIGLDLMPLSRGILKQDFLSWYPKNWNDGSLFSLPSQNSKYICIGNPPFGYRAWLALSFMQHASLFSDYIAMILPMAFQSDGKGSPKHRVENMHLVYSEILPKNSFYTPDGGNCGINALFQIWKKGVVVEPQEKTCKSWIDIFTVDFRKQRLCGMNKINDADFFLQRTYFDYPPHPVKSFSEVKYVCGYGIIVKRQKPTIIKVFNSIDWNNYSNLAAHNCRHISMYHIEKALTDKGFVDGL
jgi:hypothetical protein